MKFSSRLRNTVGAAAITLTVLVSATVAATPATYAAQPFKGSWVVTVANTDGDTIRVRDGAGSSYDQVAEAHEGDTASILDGPGTDAKGYTWYKVKLPNGAGWIRSDFLSTGGKSTSSSSSNSSSTSSATSSSNTASRAKAGAQTQTQAPSGPRLSGNARVANTDGDNLRVRKNPSQDGSVITTIAENTTVAVKQGPIVDSSKIVWYQVSVDGVTGWAMAQYLAQAASAPAKAQASKPAPQAQAPAPKAAAPVAQPAIQVAPAPASKPAPQAQQAEARSGQSRSAVAPVSSSSIASSVVGIAMRYVGYRYRFGGTTPAGFDCSGFVYYVVNHAGKSISRDMYGQLASGTRVSSSNLQPGDLLFFSNTYKRGLSHAGIYIGNGRFVHAENESTGVTVSELWSAYWASHYTTAVRIR